MPKPAWLAELTLRERLLVLLASAQSRYETALIARLRGEWPERDVRATIRELQHAQSIELDALDRVRWRVTAQGRAEAQRARSRAQRVAA